MVIPGLSASSFGFNASELTGYLEDWWAPVIRLTEFSGFLMIVLSLVRLARLGARNEPGGLTAVGVGVLIGAMLLSLSATVGSLSSTFFGSGTSSPLAMAMPQASGLSTNEILGFTVVRLIGLVGFVRGLWYLKKSGDDPSLVGHAFIRIIAGVIALHLHLILTILRNSGL